MSMTIEDVLNAQKLIEQIAKADDIVVEVRMHPNDYKRIVEEHFSKVETEEERERREKREQAIAVSGFAAMSLASIPIVVDPTRPEGKPRLVRKRERAREQLPPLTRFDFKVPKR